MVLHCDPSLAEVPGLSRHALTAVARSVEERRQQLERDIDDYIRRKQDALRCHEQEVPTSQYYLQHYIALYYYTTLPYSHYTIPPILPILPCTTLHYLIPHRHTLYHYHHTPPSLC